MFSLLDMFAEINRTIGFMLLVIVGRLLVEETTLLEGLVPLPHQSQPTWRLKDSMKLPLGL